MDTSTSAVTAAVHDGSAVLARRGVLDVRAHAELLTPLVRDVLAEAGAAPSDVTHVVGGRGPGPFTGLRVGLVTAETFAFAVGATCGGWGSLDAMAHGLWLTGDAPGRFVVATDARRKEVYWAVFAAGPGGVVREAGPGVERPADLPADVRELPCAGRGPGLYPGMFGPAVGPLDVDAGALADAAARHLSAGGALPPPRPDYLRRPDAVPQAAVKSVTAADGRRGRR